MEIWKDIRGYEDLYQISNTGRVKALPKLAGHSLRKEKILKQAVDKAGYLTIGLHKDDKLKVCKVHRLVAEAFIPNPKYGVNHRDGDKSNNHVNNLEWATMAENNVHRLATGLYKRKLSDSDIAEIKRLYPTVSISKLAVMFGVSVSPIFKVIHN